MFQITSAGRESMCAAAWFQYCLDLSVCTHNHKWLRETAKRGKRDRKLFCCCKYYRPGTYKTKVIPAAKGNNCVVSLCSFVWNALHPCRLKNVFMATEASWDTAVLGVAMTGTKAIGLFFEFSYTIKTI